MDRYLDDFEAGQIFDAGGFSLGEAQILDFAMMYDPQPFHIDTVAASKSQYGGLIASGLQTVSLCFRMVVQTGLFQKVSMGGPGVDELRFLVPVRPGDTIKVSVEVLDVKPSRSKPDRGMMRLRHRGFNQHGDEVIRFIVLMVGRRRPEGSVASKP